MSATSYVTVSIPAGAVASEVDLHNLLYLKYGDAINSLPKYDPNGYPYVYALREEAVPGYEQVFGDVGANGAVNDTPPTYQAADGSWVRYDSNTRPENDRFIYNGGGESGEGVISNRITGTTTTEMTKTWEIAAFQDGLQEVVCEFTAQCRVKGTDGEWQKVDSSNAVQTLTGWNAETLTKTITGTFPKYDAHGKELEYRWVESNVTFNDQETNFVADKNGGGSFTINVLDAEGNPETLEFTSTPTTTVGDDGSYSTQIVNTFENITDQHIDKYWEQPDVTFTVEKDGTVTLKDAPEGYSVAEGEDGIVTFTAADTPIEAQLVKTDEAGTPLSNAIFTVQGTFAGDYANETEITLSATDANGVASIPSAALITNEKYTITEVTAPGGYELAGAEFRVEGEFPDGQTEKTFASDENGIVFHQLQLTGSAEGTLYTVTETKAPEGYAQPSGSLDLLVFEDGTVQVADTSAANMKQNASVTESSGVAVVTLNNEPLPGTELPQTGDNKILPLLAGAFGLLGLWAIVMGTVAYRRFRTKGEE